MRPKGNRGDSFDPENRGHQELVRRAEIRGGVLRKLAQMDEPTQTAFLAKHPSFRPTVEWLTAAHGPNAWTTEGPSEEALGLAYELALGSLPALRSIRPSGTAHGWKLRPPALDTLPEQASWGLPLLAACTPEGVSDNALDEISHMFDELGGPTLEAFQDNFRVRLAEAIRVELELWMEAAEHGGQSPRIPYAYQFIALERFWSPAAHAGKLTAPACCLRCGTLWYPARPITAPPRCAHCNNENPKTRVWPAHAIAPDLRGLWWLFCQYDGCDNAFVGYRNRKHCDRHISSRLPRSRRRPPGG